MRQTLFYIPETLFGLPLFGWGLALGLLVAIVIVTHCYQYIRHRKISDIGGSMALLGIGGAMLVFVLPLLAEPERGFPIRGYGACLLFAILAAVALVVQLAKRHDIDSDTVYSLCFWTVITGIVGARLFYVTEYWQTMLLDADGKFHLSHAFFNVLNIAEGGLVVLGSILGGMLGSFIFMRLNKMLVLPTFDMLAPAVILGIAIGRFGCLLNGCCFGGVTDSPWSIVFPHGSPAHVHQIAKGDVFHYGLKLKEKTIDGKKILAVAEVQPNSEADESGLIPDMLLRSIANKQEGLKVQSCRVAAEFLARWQKTMPDEKVRFDFFSNSSLTEAKPFYLAPTPAEVLPVHPTQIYSSCLAFLLCGILLVLGRLRFYRQHDGLVFASFMILYSVGRFMIEFVRSDEDSFFDTGLTVSQNVSIGICLAGVVLFVYLLRRNNWSTA